MDNKKSLRSKYRNLRENLSQEDIEAMSLKIANQSLKLPIWDKTYYHIFLSIETKKEVNTEYLLHILNGRDKSIIVGKSDFETGNMGHILLQENTVLKISDYGIPEPEDGIEIAENKIDVVFVPLLIFDKYGHRVGYGKGFYDKFLTQCRDDAIFVGLSFFEAEEKIVAENTDVPLHHCITPKKIYGF